MKSLLPLLAASLALSACASSVDLNYACSPGGAKLYTIGMQEIGQCPVTVKYSYADHEVQGAKLNVAKIKAVWPSGASLIVPPTSLDIPENNQVSVMLTRPPEVADMDKDEKFAAEYEDSLPPKNVVYAAALHQDKDIFDSLNRNLTCTWDGVIQNTQSHCQ